MHIIRAAEFREQPWKNGGGTTTEVAVSPAGAALDNFGWRISMAKVKRPGPFSCFDGIDRTLAVLEGSGLALHVKDRGIVRLDRTSPPYSFPADLPVEATLAAGPIVDLNVMSRRGKWRHSLFHMTAISKFVLTRLGIATVALVRGASALIGNASGRLEDGDALVLDADASPHSVDLVIDGTADLYVVDIWPA